MPGHICVGMHTLVLVPTEDRSIRSPGAGAKGGCALCHVGAENQAQVLCRSRIGYYPMSRLSSPHMAPQDCDSGAEYLSSILVSTEFIR